MEAWFVHLVLHALTTQFCTPLEKERLNISFFVIVPTFPIRKSFFALFMAFELEMEGVAFRHLLENFSSITHTHTRLRAPAHPPGQTHTRTCMMLYCSVILPNNE